MKFSAWDKVDLVELLLPRLLALPECDATAALNAVSPGDGFTASHHAADLGAGRAFARLAAVPGIDQTVRDHHGRTAHELAMLKGLAV